jgi:hypothetical protein
MNISAIHTQCVRAVHMHDDAISRQMTLQMDIEKIKLVSHIVNKIDTDMKINIPYMINDCNYVASMSRHNYQYLV